jgi:flagellar protein FliJ
MPIFRFSLETVLRLRNQKRDECRRELGLAVSRLGLLDSQVQEVLNEQSELRAYLKQLSREGAVEGGMVSRCHMHLGQLERRHQQSLLACEEARLAVESLRQQLVKADQQVKALEKLRENQFQDFQTEQQRRELLELQEIQAAYRHGKLLS